VSACAPRAGDGCNHRGNGVQPPQERGAMVAPEPSFELAGEPSAACAGARGSPSSADHRPEAGGGAGEFFIRLGPGWPLTDRQRRRLAPMAATALEAGWAPSALASFVGANTAGVRSPYAVLAARLSSAELPLPPARARARPSWCGACDEVTRLLGFDGDAPRPCTHCHPLASRGPDGSIAYPPQTAVSGTSEPAPPTLASPLSAPRAQLSEPGRAGADGACSRPVGGR
jgi:hypothetical protein